MPGVVGPGGHHRRRAGRRCHAHDRAEIAQVSRSFQEHDRRRTGADREAPRRRPTAVWRSRLRPYRAGSAPARRTPISARTGPVWSAPTRRPERGAPSAPRAHHDRARRRSSMSAWKRMACLTAWKPSSTARVGSLRARRNRSIRSRASRLPQAPVMQSSRPCRAAAHPTMSTSAKKNAISRAAVSGASLPCTELASIDSAKSLRIVPACGLGRIGRAHDLAVRLDRVLALEHLHHDRPRGHELAQGPIEGPLPVHGVERLGLGAAQA